MARRLRRRHGRSPRRSQRVPERTTLQGKEAAGESSRAASSSLRISPDRSAEKPTVSNQTPIAIVPPGFHLVVPKPEYYVILPGFQQEFLRAPALVALTEIVLGTLAGAWYYTEQFAKSV